jgi:hypothetical protein
MRPFPSEIRDSQAQGGEIYLASRGGPAWSLLCASCRTARLGPRVGAARARRIARSGLRWPVNGAIV